MEHEHDNDLVELGIASADTQGEKTGWPSEGTCYYAMGLMEL
jgi:hypothetical protein